jgi:peptide/nickel transport system substrate-binding protein
VDVRQVARDEKVLTYRQQKTQMILQNWFVDYPDPDDFALPFGDYTQKALAWRLQFYNDPLSKLTQQASSLTNGPERSALYKKVNDAMAEDGPFAVLYQPMLSLGVSRRMEKLTFDPVNFIDFLHLTKK